MKDLTKDNPRRVIITFALPILFGYLLQLCYSLSDTRIVSSLLGEDALSAVGSTSSLSNMVIGFLNGLTNGFAVIIARYFGSKEEKNLKKAIATSISLGIGIALFLTVLMLLLLPGILRLLNLPNDIYDTGYSYISIILSGMTMSMLYNVSAGILRAIGDTLTPMFFLFLSVVLNIGGDFFCIRFLDLGVSGAAFSTVIAQSVAMILCFTYMWIRYPLLRVKKSDFLIQPNILRNLLSCGISMGLMSCLVNIGTLSLQTGINDLGKPYIVAHTAARKITELYMMMFSVFGSTIATYCSQNYGAGKKERIREGLIETLKIVGVWCILVAISAWTIAPTLIHLVAGDISQLSADTAALYLRVDTLLYLVAAMITILRNALQGIGDHVTPIISSFIECIGKILIVSLLVPLLHYWGVILAEPIVWCLMVIPLIIQIIRNPNLRKNPTHN